MSRRAPRLALIVSALALTALTGCVTETPSGSGSTYKFEWWIPTGLTVVSLLAIVGGVFAVSRKKNGGWIAVLVGIIGLVLGPSMFFDRAVVDDEHFELRTGIVFSPTTFDIKWDNVASIYGSSEQRTGRRGRKSTSHYLNFVLKSGGTEKVPIGDLMKEGADRKVMEMAQKKGIKLAGAANGIE